MASTMGAQKARTMKSGSGLFDIDDSDTDSELELGSELVGGMGMGFGMEAGPTSATPSDGSDGSRSAFSGFSNATSSSRSSVLTGPSAGGSGLGVDRIKSDRLKPETGLGSPNQNDIDIQIWKSHVEKDLDELRRTLIEVQTRLGR